MKRYLLFMFFLRRIFQRKKIKEFDLIFKTVYKHERIKYKPLAKEFEKLNIDKKIFRRELKRLLILGFMTRTIYLNGEKAVEIIDDGKDWFYILYA